MFLHLALLGLVPRPGLQHHSTLSVCHRHAHVSAAEQTLTERLFKSYDDAQSSGAGGASTLEGLQQLDKAWAAMRSGAPPAPPQRIVFEDPHEAVEVPDVDVAVAGGNIGILLGMALQAKGLRVAVLEAGLLRGRSQDWNASLKEIEELVKHGVITREDMDSIVGIVFNPMRVGFVGGEDVWMEDVLNVGIRPDVLISTVRKRFEDAGGLVYEKAPLASVSIRPGAAVLETATGEVIRARLLLDCMGQRSFMVQTYSRAHTLVHPPDTRHHHIRTRPRSSNRCTTTHHTYPTFTLTSHSHLPHIHTYPTFTLRNPYELLASLPAYDYTMLHPNLHRRLLRKAQSTPAPTLIKKLARHHPSI